MSPTRIATLVAVVSGLMLATAFPALAQGTSAPPSAPADSAEHAGHSQEHPKPSAPSKPAAEGPHDHAGSGEPPQELPPFIPRLTDEDRKAAFPDVQGHMVHDNSVNYFVLFDQLEWQAGGTSGVNWDNKSWVGRDRNRVWFRTEGASADGRMGDAEAHVLYGRAIARWWDLVAGVRQEFRPGPGQTWAAFGIQGLAPYWFEVEATGYVGEGGQTSVRFEVEYELLLTNRLVLQPLAELDLYGKTNEERGIGAGLGAIEAGVRLRFEHRRELAPYVGVTWHRKYGKTADFAEAAGQGVQGARFVTGLRLWF